MALGISRREFAKRDGCDERLVRNAIESGHLPTLEDGTLDPALVGTGWRKTNRKKGAAGADVRTQSARARPDETPEDAARRIVMEEDAASERVTEAVVAGD